MCCAGGPLNIYVILSHLSNDLSFTTCLAIDWSCFLKQLSSDTTKLSRFGLQQLATVSSEQDATLTNKVPLRVTTRRTTPGVWGSAVASSPLSLPEDMWRSFVKSERLSRRDPCLFLTASLAK